MTVKIKQRPGRPDADWRLAPERFTVLNLRGVPPELWQRVHEYARRRNQTVRRSLEELVTRRLQRERSG